MSLESSIRYGNEGPHRRIFASRNAQHYGTPDPFAEAHVDWRWLDLWDQENPYPNTEVATRADREEWFREHDRMRRRCWTQFHFPNLRIMDWPDDRDLDDLFRLASRHICGVCGRADDPGCSEGC